MLCAIAPGPLLHIKDMYSGQLFLIDTGASYSIIPHRSSSPTCGPALTNADGQALPCWGERTRTLLLGGQKVKWTFLLAGTQMPILGVDFIRH